jgi:hypothetical protein
MRPSPLALGLLALSLAAAAAQTPPPGDRIPLPERLPASHPRVAAIPGNSRAEILARIAADPEAQAEVVRAEAELAPFLAHTAADPMWLASRLQMYWTTHATDVYNRGDAFDHAAGRAPVPTVRYPGSRDPLTVYKAPRLEDIPPFEDDTKGVLLVNGSLPGQPLEWASPAKSGRIIDGINTRILSLAETSARLFWLTGDARYAQLAAPVLDTYLRGMLARNEPIDLTHGHSQTIYGMSTFEVIQESILPLAASTFDFLFDYTRQHDASALPIYADALRRWTDVTVHNGVPNNNWDLIEARFIAAVALVLDPDSAYPDRRGEQYYLNLVLNDSVTRQWSLARLSSHGYDPRTGIWYEAPGYALNVAKDFIALINDLDTALGTDLLPRLPVIEKAVFAVGQYLYPSGYTVAFGDSHHILLPSEAAREMVRNAQRHHRREQEVRFTAMAKLLEADAAVAGHPQAAQKPHGLASVFAAQPEALDPSIPAATLADLTSPVFTAPNVSYLVQRSGLDSENGLMAAESGSIGNHQHANGIALEFYGRGTILAPSSGPGTNYFEADHSEYYAQFPAANTVAVDGISSYPIMRSAHPFELRAAFPPPSLAQPGRPAPPASITFTDVYFHEPETDSDQRRLVGIVRTSAANGFYIDIFRSRRRDGQDRMHDYFFHGIGQSLELTDTQRRPLALHPTEELTFANEELPAYDYFYDKRSIATALDVRAAFTLSLPQRPDVGLNLWMAGSPRREIFAVKAPPSHGAREILPPSMPTPTFVARQQGEAWNHPFVAVFEPVDASHPTAIARIERFTPPSAPADFVGLDIHDLDGSRRQVFNAAEPASVEANGISFTGTYAIAGESNADRLLFLGSGTLLARDGIVLRFDQPNASAELHYGTVWTLTSTAPVHLVVSIARLDGKTVLTLTDAGRPLSIPGHPTQSNGVPALQFDLPALDRVTLTW